MKINLLELDGLLIEVLRKPIKNMHLRIYPPDGRVVVSAPLRFSLRLISKELEAKRDWIHKQRALFKAQSKPLANYESGEQHFFMGQTYPLLVHHATKPMHIALKDEVIHCFINRDLTAAEKQKLLENWYRQQMKAQVPALLAKWEAIIGVSVNSWGIKVMKTRWGSCNPAKRRISLNLSLIKKPIACLEYVLVHELVHLLEASHNRRFHALMDQFLPHWRDINKLLSNGD